MTAHDDLRRQLTHSVKATAAGARRPRRRRRASRRGPAILVLAVTCGGGVAGAATQLLSGREPGDGARARQLYQQAVMQASTAKVCQRASGRFVPGAALEEIEQVFPARTAPISPALRQAVLRYAGGPILERSVRLVRFPAGERLLVYATLGKDLYAQVDPQACDRVQRAKLTALHPEDDSVRRLALVLLAIDQKRPPGRQILTIMALGRHGSGGTGMPVRAGRPLPTGVAFSGGSASATHYGGIAVAGARTITLTTGAGATHPLHRTIGVRERLFAFTLPRATGPVTLRQRAADGTTLAAQRIRG